MFHIALPLLAATLCVAGCASQERINEAQSDLFLAAYRTNTAAMSRASNEAYDATFGPEEKGAPARAPDPSVKIVYLDLSAEDFETSRAIAASIIYGSQTVTSDSLTAGFALPRYLGTGMCIVYQVRVGDLAKLVNGKPMFVVTPYVHARVRAHEVRHCSGETHDERNVWQP